MAITLRRRRRRSVSKTYTLCLELQLVKGGTRETLFCGSAGSISQMASFRFEVPGDHTAREETTQCFPLPSPRVSPREAGLDRAFDLVYDHGYELEAKVVATRLHRGRLQFAKLFHGGIDGLEDEFVFEHQHIPVRNDAAAWAERAADPNHDTGRSLKPQLNLYWMPGDRTATHCPLYAIFAWGTNSTYEGNFNENMSASDARVTLEHYADWK